MSVFINLCAFVSNLSGFDEFRHSLLACLFKSQVNVSDGLKFGFWLGPIVRYREHLRIGVCNMHLSLNFYVKFPIQFQKETSEDCIASVK